MEKLYLQRASLKGFLFTVIYFSFFYLPKNIAQQIIPGADELHNDYESSYFYQSEEINDLFPTNHISTTSLNPNPQIPTLNSNSPICIGAELQLIASTIPGATYQWTGPAGFSSNEQNPTFADMNTYKEGTYELVVVVDGCSSEPVTIEVVVNKLPRLIPTNNAAICGSDLKLFSNVSFATPNYLYTWTGPDGFTSTSSNPVILNPTAAAEGTYVLTVTNEEGCTSSDSTSVQLYDTTPTGPIINSNFEEQVCSGAELVLSTLQIVDANVNYEWYGPNGTFTSNGDYPNAPIITIPAASNSNQGWYFVVITIDGCSTFISEGFNVGVYPQPGVNPTSLILGSIGDCVGPGSQVRLYSNPYAGTGFFTDFYWQGPGGATYGTENLIFDEFDTSLLGEYSVVVFDDNGCESVSETMSIDFPAVPPTPVFQNGDEFAEVLCPGASLSLSVDELDASDVTYNWFFNGVPIDNNAATLNIDNLTVADAGTYSLSVSVGGCPSDTIPVVINVSDLVDQPVILMSGTTCENSNVTLSINPYSGTNVNYTWTGPSGPINNNSHTLNFNSVSTTDSGVYQIEVMANGCTFLSDAFELSIGEQPVMNVLPVDPVSCADGSQDISLISFPNTADPLDVLWSGPGGFTSTEQTPVLTGVNSSMSGVYTVTATNASGCISEPTSLEIVIDDAVEQPVINTDVTACAGSDLILSAQEYSGTNVTYNWVGPNGPISNNTNELILNGLEINDAGDYFLTVEIEGCQSPQGTYALTVFPPLVASVDESNIPDLLCTDGTISLDLFANVSGGLAPYTYTWSGPAGFSSSEANPSISNISDQNAGTYNVQVIDANGCMSDASAAPANVEINIADAIAEPVIVMDGKGCSGSEVILHVDAYAGTNVSYNWVGPNGPISNNSNELVLGSVEVNDSGNYYLEVQIDGCASPQNTFNLTVFPPLVASVDVSDIPELLCEGDNTSLDLYAFVAGGLPPYDYSWSGPAGFNSSEVSPSIPNVSEQNAGTYSVQAIDAVGCASDATTDPANVEVNISSVAQPVITSAGVSCVASEVTLSVDVYSGTDVSYMWTGPNGSINNNSNVLPLGFLNVNNTGEYSVEVMVDGCSSVSDAIALDVNQAPVVSIENSGVPCASSTSELLLSANPSGGQAPYTYEWTGPNNFESNDQNPIIPGAGSLYTGTYSLIITDANGCSSVPTLTEVELTDAPEAPGVGGTTELCEGDILQLLSDTNYPGDEISYNWNTPSGVVSTTEPFLIVNPVDPSFTGAYSLEAVVDGCTSATSVMIEVTVTATPGAPELEGTTMGICENEPLILTTSTTADEYQWEGPNNYSSNQEAPTVTDEMSNLESGAYSLVVFENGCVSPEATINISLNPQPSTPTLESNNDFCEGTSIELFTNNYQAGNVYTWVGPQGIDASIGNPLLVTNDASTANSTIIPVGDVAYEPGMWSLVVTNSFGCSSEFSPPVEINVLALPDDPQPSNNGPLCEGQPAQLFGGTQNDVNYRWYDGDPNGAPAGVLISEEQNPQLGGLPTGTYMYWLEVEREGCVSANVVPTELIVEIAPEITPVSNTGPYCEGEMIQLNGPEMQGASYIWTGPDGFISNEEDPQIDLATATNAGVYSLVVNIGFCESLPSNTEVIILPLPPMPVVENTSPACVGSSIELMATNVPSGTVIEYQWTGPDGFTSDLENPIINNLDSIDAGAYTLIVIVDGCVSEVSLPTMVEVVELITASAVANNSNIDAPVCEGEVVALFAETIPGATYTWEGPNNFSSTLQNPTITNSTLLAAGAYTLSVSVGDCETILPNVTTVYIQESPEAPLLQFVEPACEGSTVIMLIPEIEPWVTYTWYSALTNMQVATGPTYILNNVAMADAGQYYVIADVDGCESEPSMPVEIIVSELPNELAYAGEEINLCNEFTTNLEAFYPTMGTGGWMSPTGATIITPDTNTTIVTDLVEGDNVFVWSVSNGNCWNYSTDTVHVYVSVTTNEIANAGLDQNLCNEESTSLEAVPVNQSEGMWVQETTQSSLGVVITDPLDPNTTVTGMVPGNTYKFTWTLNSGYCVDFENDFVLVSIEAETDNIAYAGEDDFHCDEPVLFLDAVEPDGATGAWSTTSQASILNPMSASTEVIDLQQGSNQFIWSISTVFCQNISSDTIYIYSEGTPIAGDDVENTDMNSRIDVINLLLNDQLPSANYDFSILTAPEFGTVEILTDGVVSYEPDEDYVGMDVFEYLLCNANCPDLCDTARVVIDVRFEDEPDLNCFIPSIFTPNGDGVNDGIEINCIQYYPENELIIFNRLGDKVYSAAPYQNDWKGTYKGSPLPDGSYYYMLKLNDEARTILSGYVIIKR